jgi:hypothetical protein
MSSTSPVELSASGIIQRIEAGEYPDGILANIAAGFLPLPQDELIAILAYLATARSGEIGETAQRSLSEVPVRSIHAFASNEAIPAEHLEMLMNASHDPAVLEALIRNRGVRDETVVALAARADAMVQEVIVINQARILRAPQILDALESNPQLTHDVRRRVFETREEFFEKKARLAPVRAPEEVPDDEVYDELPVDDISDLLAKAEEQAPVEATIPDLMESEKGDEKKVSVFSKILTMSVSQKVQLAFKGGKTERMILIRDRNRLVCSAVMRNPRINDAEVELIAGMRNIDEEVMRLISMKREWMAKYNIVIVLCRNPKVPIGVVLPLINRLTLRDLKGLKDDKGVPEVVRGLARKVFVQRNQKA